MFLCTGKSRKAIMLNQQIYTLWLQRYIICSPVFWAAIFVCISLQTYAKKIWVAQLRWLNLVYTFITNWCRNAFVSSFQGYIKQTETDSGRIILDQIGARLDLETGRKKLFWLTKPNHGHPGAQERTQVVPVSLPMATTTDPLGQHKQAPNLIWTLRWGGANTSVTYKGLKLYRKNPSR